jgi:RNA polymerase sigma-70 factor (ECF subfamily)
MAEGASLDLAPVFEAERSFLWSVSYRLTGSATDADDIVQETFLRAIQRPPQDRERPWRPWLTRVAVNMGRDLLRRRRRRGYDGPWLPELVSTADPASPPSFEPREHDGPAARYDRLESVSIAFLLALEALTPAQRAVLLLRDVFDYSVREAADVLDLSLANVKTTHRRARLAMEAYDRERCIPTPAAQTKAAQTLQRFLTCLAAHDVAAVESMLAEDVQAISDGGGEFHTARRVVRGRDKVARFFIGLNQRAGVPTGVQLLVVNGLPAVLVDLTPASSGWSPRALLQVRLDAEGYVRTVYTVLATRKLAPLASASVSRRGVDRSAAQ